MSSVLKAPFPWFGGKKTVATLIWSRLGNVDNYVEPFAGSCAVLLLRPHPPRIETLNDADHYVANFWRATQQDPEAVVSYADGPVSEVDLHSRHRWLVLSDHAKEFRERMRADPDFYDVKVAGWWCWGLCAWIGGGWCSTPRQLERNAGSTPTLTGSDGTGQGVHALGPCGEQHGTPELSQSRPRISGPGHGTKYGDGVHAKGPTEQHGAPELSHLKESRPRIDGRGHGPGDNTNAIEPGVLGRPSAGGRPQLADAYSLGRGVHAGPAGGLSQALPSIGTGAHGGDSRRGIHAGEMGTCEQRRLWLLDWFGRLRDRLRNVRVCCGDWTRVCSSESVTTRLGLTGVFLDPPYGTLAKRAKGLYAQDSMTVAEQARRWCLERGPDPQLRIALCGYAGEGHEVLEKHGWECVAWEAGGGYGNRTKQGKANAKKERIWFSPACEREPTLFDNLEVDNGQSQP